MKKLLLISVLFGLMPLSMAAQVDDLYFVPKKKSATKVTDNYGLPREVYYSGSDRSVDEYNRRVSHYDLIAKDSTLNDTIHFSAEKGVYPDSTLNEDFEITRKMSRFDDYRIADNEAFWAGYEAGRYDWGWHSPWYYTRFGWYDPWYYPWYWNDPWYYSGYYGWYGGWYAGWYDPWYYGWGYPYPYPYYGYYRSYPVYYGGGYVRNTPRYNSPRQTFGTGRNRFGTSGRTTAGRGSFGGSYSHRGSSTSATRMPSSGNSGSFGGSRSSGSSGSFGGGGRSGGGGSFGGGGGGGRSGGGGGFGRHR
jgi:hypothetical protein